MSDAPETIWAWLSEDGVPRAGECFDDPIIDGLTQYTRTDLADARLAAKDAEIERLREAMKAIARFIDHPAHYNAHIDQICRAALEVELHGS